MCLLTVNNSKQLRFQEQSCPLVRGVHSPSMLSNNHVAVQPHGHVDTCDSAQDKTWRLQSWESSFMLVFYRWLHIHIACICKMPISLHVTVWNVMQLKLTDDTQVYKAVCLVLTSIQLFSIMVSHKLQHTKSLISGFAWWFIRTLTVRSWRPLAAWCRGVQLVICWNDNYNEIST